MGRYAIDRVRSHSMGRDTARETVGVFLGVDAEIWGRFRLHGLK